MNTFAIAGISCGISCMILALITLAFGRLKIHRLLAFFNIAVAIWGFGGFIVGIANNEPTAIFGWKFAHIGGMFVSILFFHLVCIFCTIHRRWLLIFGYLQAIVFNFISWIPDKLITKARFVYGLYYNDATIVFSLAVFSYVLLVSLSFWELLNFLKESKGFKREQALYIIFGFLCGFVGGTSTFLPEFKIDFLYPFGNFGIVLYSLIVTYAILRYRLLDINIALTRAGIFAIVYTLVLGIPFWFGIKTGLWVYSTIIMAVLATTGPFAFIYLSRKAEARFLKEERRAHELLKQASRGMIHIHSKKKLLDLIDHITTKTLKLDNAEVFLLDENSGSFKLSAVRFRSKYQYSEIISNDDTLIQKLSTMEEPLVYEEVKLKKQELENEPNDRIHEIESQMRRLKAAIIVPAISNGRLVAFLALGEKTSKRMYSQEDLSTLWALSYQAALAIDNAFLYEKEKMRLAEQSRRQALADMAPGASHQFNNRLTTISVTADNLLDLVKNDAHNFSKEQLMDTVSEELEIIKGEVAKGKQITAAILQKAQVKLEFDKVDITKVIQNAINLTRLRRTRESLGGAKAPEFVFNYPNDLPLLTLCEGTMQDVFENMFNNAYDAIVIHGKRKIEPLPYQGKITITISRKDNSVIIVVEDNGIGIQKDNLHKLFTELFTTKATAEKGVVGGSGLGLAVMRSFVEGHGGTITVDSEYTKWTRLTITLPIDFKPSKQ